eukprot:m.174146 g.174146  ORF g.174146 m.174146 type:complete len:413 (+) comp13793_c0_seq1:259-1497(+)
MMMYARHGVLQPNELAPLKCDKRAPPSPVSTSKDHITSRRPKQRLARLDIELLHRLEQLVEFLNLGFRVAGREILAKVWRQLEGGHVTSVVPNDQDGVVLVERDVRQLAASLDDLRDVHGLRLGHGEVKDVQEPVGRDGCKLSRGVRCPGDIANRRTEIKLKEAEWVVMVPHLDRPVRRARDKHARVERVPLETVHCHGVCFVHGEKLGIVGLGALHDASLFGTHQVQVLLCRVEGKACAGKLGRLHVGCVRFLLRRRQFNDIAVLELVLHHGPASDQRVGRHRVKVVALVQIVRLPLHLPHGIRVLARERRRLVCGLHALGLVGAGEVVDGDRSVVASHAQQVGFVRHGVDRCHTRLGGNEKLGSHRVLKREACNGTSALLQVVVRAKANDNEVRRPGDERDTRDVVTLVF